MHSLLPAWDLIALEKRECRTEAAFTHTCIDYFLAGATAATFFNPINLNSGVLNSLRP